MFIAPPIRLELVQVIESGILKRSSMLNFPAKREIGLKEALGYVHLGDVHGTPPRIPIAPVVGISLSENSFMFAPGGSGNSPLRNDIADGRCTHCGFPIWGTFNS